MNARYHSDTAFRKKQNQYAIEYVKNRKVVDPIFAERIKIYQKAYNKKYWIKIKSDPENKSITITAEQPNYII